MAHDQLPWLMHSYLFPASVLMSQAENIRSLPEREQAKMGFRLLSVGFSQNHLWGAQIRIRLAWHPSESARQVIYDVLGFCWDCHCELMGGDKLEWRAFVSDGGNIYLDRCSHYEDLPLVVEVIGRHF